VTGRRRRAALNVRLSGGALLPGRCRRSAARRCEPVVVECRWRSIRGAPSVRSSASRRRHWSSTLRRRKNATVRRERNSGVGVGNANHLCLTADARDIEDEHILIGAVEVRWFRSRRCVITAGQYQHRASIRAHGETYRTISREVGNPAAGLRARTSSPGGGRRGSWPVGSSVALGVRLQLHAPGAVSPTSLSRSTVGCRDRDSITTGAAASASNWHPGPRCGMREFRAASAVVRVR